MKFGLILPSYLPSASAGGLRRAATEADQLGFDSVWTTDHVMIGRHQAVPYQSTFEAVSTLGWLAALTTHIRLGISVVVVPQRQPVLLAKELATLDQLSGGRMILGVGAGWCEEEFGFLNADFRHRGRILNEAIEAMRLLWTAPEQAYEGQFITFRDHAFAPGPVQQGGIPIWVGGNSEAALKRAARLGDGWHGNLAPLDTMKARIAQLRSFGAARDLVLSARAQVADERREQEPGSGRMFSLGGPAQTIIDDLHRYEDAGLSMIAAGFWDGDLDRFFERLHRFAAEVMPKA